MPPLKQQYAQMLDSFEQSIESFDATPENMDALYNDYYKIRKFLYDAEGVYADVKYPSLDKKRPVQAFIAAADKFGEPFWGQFRYVPEGFPKEYIKRFREEVRTAAKSHGAYDQEHLAQRFYDTMKIAYLNENSDKLTLSPDIEKMYSEVKKLIGEERADHIFEIEPDYYRIMPNVKAAHEKEIRQQNMQAAAERRRLEKERAAELKRQQEAREKEINDKIEKDVKAKIERAQKADEEHYDILENANVIIKKAFEKEDLSERLSALLEKKEADSKAIDKICANKTDEERETIEQSLNDDVAFLNDLKKYTKRLCEYGQGDDMRPIDATVKTIQNKFPAQLERLFAALPNEEPGSMEHKDRLEMIQACGSMLVNTRRFANTAAASGLPLNGVEVKDPMATVRKTLQLFSEELDRIPKDDDDSELFTTFKDALEAAANGGSLKDLSTASMNYYNGRKGILFGPFTEVGKHRLNVSDHVFEFLEDIHYGALEKEAQKKAEQPKAAAPRVEQPRAAAPRVEQPRAEAPRVEQPKRDSGAARGQIGRPHRDNSFAQQPPEVRVENGWAARQNMQNGRREEFIAELQALGFTREEIEEQKAAFESLNNGNNGPANAGDAFVNEDRVQQQQGGLQMGNFG